MVTQPLFNSVLIPALTQPFHQLRRVAINSGLNIASLISNNLLSKKFGLMTSLREKGSH